MASPARRRERACRAVVPAGTAGRAARPGVQPLWQPAKLPEPCGGSLAGGTMRDRIDPLIEERARWLFRGTPTSRIARGLLDRALGYRRTLEIAERYRDLPT